MLRFSSEHLNLRSALHLWDKMIFPVVVSFPHHHSTSGSANSTVRYSSTGKNNFTGGAYIHTGHNVPSFPVGIMIVIAVAAFVAFFFLLPLLWATLGVILEHRNRRLLELRNSRLLELRNSRSQEPQTTTYIRRASQQAISDGSLHTNVRDASRSRLGRRGASSVGNQHEELFGAHTHAIRLAKIQIAPRSRDDAAENAPAPSPPWHQGHDSVQTGARTGIDIQEPQSAAQPAGRWRIDDDIPGISAETPPSYEARVRDQIYRSPFLASEDDSPVPPYAENYNPRAEGAEVDLELGLPARST